MALATMQSDGGLTDITTLLNLVKDQKTTSTTSNNITTAGVQAQINEILGSNQGLAAVAGGAHSAGFYNSSVNTQLVNDLLTRTAATVAARNASTTTTNSKKAPLNKQQLALTAASLALKNSDKLKSLYQGLSSKVTGSGTADAAADPISESLTASEMPAIDTAGAVNGTSLSGSGVGSSIGTTGSDGSYEALGGLFDEAGIDGGSATATAASATSGADAAGLEALDSAAAAGTVGTGATAAQVASFGAGADAGAAGAAADFGGGATAAGGAGEGALSATGWGALALATYAGAKNVLDSGDKNASGFLKGTGDVGTSAVIQGLDSGNMADSINPWARDVLDNVGLGGAVNAIGTKTDDIIKGAGDAIKDGTGWIVCTELVKQGRMPRGFYIPGLRVFHSYRLDLLDGYYVWARPTVKLLREKPFCIRSRIVCWLFNHRAEYLAACSHVRNAKCTVTGAVISHALYGFCYTLGQILKFAKTTNKEKLA